MSNMIRVYNGVPVPYSEKQFRLDILPSRAPSGYLPDDFLERYNVFRVKHMPPPLHDETKIPVENELPELIDGVWTKTWSLMDKSREDINELINEERDKRVLTGFTWNGKQFQSDAASISNMNAAALSALMFLYSGGDPDSTNWDFNNDFVWLTASNEKIILSAKDMIELNDTARLHIKNHVFCARILKDSENLVKNYKEDSNWPEK